MHNFENGLIDKLTYDVWMTDIDMYDPVSWCYYDGPSFLERTGHYSEKDPNASYTREDFRFTPRDNTLYAICLAIPEGEAASAHRKSRVISVPGLP